MFGIPCVAGALIHKNKLTGRKYTGTVSPDEWDINDTYSLDDTIVLIKEKHRDFVILNITDIHFSDCDVRTWMAFPACVTVKKLVKKIKPDLITVSGDIVCGKSTVYSIRRFTDLMESFGIPWAPVFGNHDADGNCDYNYLADVMMKGDNCLMKKGAPNLGAGNYVVNIAEKNDDGSLEVVHSLILMDTDGKHFNSKQIQWYKWAAQGISRLSGRAVESSVMFHIPVVQYQYAYDEAWDTENSCWKQGYDAWGELHEKICCRRDENGTPVDNGFFAAVKETGTTKNIICGHDHMNNFSVMYQGIRLSYTLKVGEGSGRQPGFNGGTVININNCGLTLRHEYIKSIL